MAEPRPDLEAIRARATMLAAIRAWLAKEGFVEVETPILFRAPGLNPHIAEFETRYEKDPLRRGASERLWLRTSPEVFHKRLLAAGLPRFYELGRFFRNGERTDAHNPEFTGLELYEANADYRRVMEITEQVLAAAITAVAGSPRVAVAGRAIDVTPPWDRLTVRDAFARVGVTLPETDDVDALAAEARRAGIPVEPDDRFDDVFFRVMVTKIERELGFAKPVFLHDYPASMGVMARRKPGDPSVAERVEVYLAGVELANGFSELTDAAEQRARFEADRALVAGRDGVAPESLPLDEGFLEALSRMPPSTGIAIGLDRVLQLALGRKTLADVIPFPFQGDTL